MSAKPFVSRLPFLVALALICGCSQNRAPSKLSQALRDASSVELHSLDPSQEKANGSEESLQRFQTWVDLGWVDVSDITTRTQLLDSLDAGIAANNGVAAACCDPRHGIRAKHNGKVYDVVICFRCYQAKWYIDNVEQEGFLLTEMPRPTFNKILNESNIELAPTPE